MIIKNPNYSNEYYGMSTDTKPINALNASRFYEIDTGNVYMFDEEGKQWFKQRGNASSSNASSGSSGGSSSSAGSGILIVNLTVNADTRVLVLDKTWQEIHDANLAVVKYEASAGGESVTARYIIVNTQIVNGIYAVTILGVKGGSDTTQTIIFTTNSPDGYPSYTIDTTPQG